MAYYVDGKGPYESANFIGAAMKAYCDLMVADPDEAEKEVLLLEVQDDHFTKLIKVERKENQFTFSEHV